MTIQEINQQIAEIQANISRKPLIEEEKKHLTTEMRELKTQEEHLLNLLKKEQKDVDNLQKLTLKSFVATLKGTKDYQLHQEEYELVEAKATYDRFKIQQKLLQDEWNKQHQTLLDIEQQEEQLSDLILTKRTLISEQPDEIGQRLSNMMDNYASLRRQEKELKEAINAGKASSNSLYMALESLQSAKNWGTYDMLSRGGLIAHAVKYNRIDTAQARLSKAQIEIRKFQKELKDVNLTINSTYIDISDAQRTIDFWFDNIFTDYNVLGKITDTIYYAQKNRTTIQKTLSNLRSSLSDVQTKMRQLNTDMNDITIEYKEKSSPFQ